MSDNIAVLRAARENAEPYHPEAKEAPVDQAEPPAAPPEDVGDDDGKGGKEWEAPGLPETSPVKALGKEGRVYYYLDALGQFVELSDKDHQRLPLMGLFGRKTDFLYEVWPRMSVDKQTGRSWVTGWKPELCAESLMQAAATKVWSPLDKVRGAGAWRSRDGELILHCGDRLHIFAADGSRRTLHPGVVDGFVYPTAPATPQPFEAQQKPGADGPGMEVIRLIDHWNTRRQETVDGKRIDSTLALGWVIAAMLGGALDWRPVMYVTGGFATGKSTYQRLVQWLLGSTGIISVSDTSAAGIWQKVKYSSLPVAVDEFEAEEDNRKVLAVLNLARQAASGGLILRGGTEHTGKEFRARSCFLFSSILVPPLLPQDRSRIVVIELDPLDPAKRPPTLSERAINDLGRRLLRRACDQWPRFGETLAAYQATLIAHGHKSRSADVFGHLLACADLALYDRVPDGDTLDDWGRALAAAGLVELEDDLSDDRACLNHLLTASMSDPQNRKERPIARWVAIAAGKGEIGGDDPDEAQRLHANELLTTIGLKYLYKDGHYWLAVANQHTALARIFDKTQWGARAGANGVWKQSLGRLPGAKKGEQVWYPPNQRSVLVPLGLFLPGFSSPGGDGTNGSAAGRSPGTPPASGMPAGEASDRSAADAASFDSSAAGPSPAPTAANGTTEAEARDRSAADTASISPAPTPSTSSPASP